MEKTIRLISILTIQLSYRISNMNITVMLNQRLGCLLEAVLGREMQCWWAEVVETLNRFDNAIKTNTQTCLPVEVLLVGLDARHEKTGQHVVVSLEAGPVSRCSALFIFDVHLGARLEQLLHHLEIVVDACHCQTESSKSINQFTKQQQQQQHSYHV